jgi:putative flippase GtrA
VSFPRELYARFRHLIHELAKFGIIGFIGFIITAVSFVGNRWWTFRHRERTNVRRETLMFFVLNGVGLGIQLACIGFTYYALGLTDHFAYNIALIVGIVFGTLFRFWSYRKWVWAAKPDEAPPQRVLAGQGAGPK